MEIREILGSEFTVRDLSDMPDVPEIAEIGKTFEENAVLKAVAGSQHVNGLVLADDSGIEVDALDGAPGVFSARYAGEPADDNRNIAKLMGELELADPEKVRREARFRCVLAIAGEGEVRKIFAGVVDGTIADSPTGSKGFGYDPIFIPLGFAQTFAELPPGIKNELSHRGRALRSALPFLKTALRTS
jgi:XTP/dITP diphosphohydrolase